MFLNTGVFLSVFKYIFQVLFWFLEKENWLSTIFIIANFQELIFKSLQREVPATAESVGRSVLTHQVFIHDLTGCNDLSIQN